jgi:predicted Fe-S protein YdhL (DUF1289 family)
MNPSDPQEQLELFPIPSPCVGRCQTDSRGYCIGCLRSREERFGWLKFSPAQQREIIRLCKQRKYRRWLASQKQMTEEEKAISPTLPLFDNDNQS